MAGALARVVTQFPHPKPDRVKNIKTFVTHFLRQKIIFIAKFCVKTLRPSPPLISARLKGEGGLAYE